MLQAEHLPQLSVLFTVCLTSDIQEILQKHLLHKVIELNHRMKLHIIVKCSVLTVPNLLFIMDQKGYLRRRRYHIWVLHHLKNGRL